jgi:hypothetical protein
MTFSSCSSSLTRTEIFSAEDKYWPRKELLAEGCNEVHGLSDPSLYRTLDSVGIHIVYFTWLSYVGLL